jgi:hypothetical protein
MSKLSFKLLKWWTLILHSWPRAPRCHTRHLRIPKTHSSYRAAEQQTIADPMILIACDMDPVANHIWNRVYRRLMERRSLFLRWEDTGASSRLFCAGQESLRIRASLYWPEKLKACRYMDFSDVTLIYFGGNWLAEQHRNSHLWTTMDWTNRRV